MRDYYDAEDDTEITIFVALLSKCCGMPAMGEIHDNEGICSGCRDHAEFEQEIEPE